MEDLTGPQPQADSQLGTHRQAVHLTSASALINEFNSESPCLQMTSNCLSTRLGSHEHNQEINEFFEPPK